MNQADASWQQLAGRGYAAFRQLIEYGKTSGAIDPELSTDTYLRYVQLVQQAILSDPSLSTSSMTESMQDYFRFSFTASFGNKTKKIAFPFLCI